MDQELIAYLDERFREISQQLAGVREENSQQIASLREETGQQIASFREETGQQIAGLREEMTSFREESSRRFEQVDEEIRHTRVEVEGLRGEVRLLAEGIASVEERLASFRRQVTGDIEDVRVLIRPSYSALDDRLKSLESWRERKERDPLEVIRERFGLGKGPSWSSG